MDVMLILTFRSGYGTIARFVNVAMAAAVLLMAPDAGAETLRIVALGDSLTAGYGLAREDSFPARLEAALRAEGLDAVVVNAGVSGDTSAGGRSRIDWALAPGPGGEADAAIVELGANDGLRGLDPAATEANLDAILERIRARGIPALLAGMKAPPNLGPEYGADFEAIYPRLAERPGVSLYPFFLDGVAAVPELNQDDGIHPNPAGVEVIVERILPYVRDMLESVGNGMRR
jgi:acyl-CoA thioesterase-1